MQALILRFDAPLVSFGSDAVDSNRITDVFPRRSMIVGLLANGLGYDHADWEKIQRLQERLCYAVRCDRTGQSFVDFQTVDLGQDFLLETWTTRNVPESRGGSVSTGTHIQLRHYMADAVYTLAVGLANEKEEAPTVRDLERAVLHPARPLCFGRKSCVPSEYVYQGFRTGLQLYEILVQEPRLPDRYQPHTGKLAARWPAGGRLHEPTLRSQGGWEVFLTEDRDWRNGIHVGRRRMMQGWMNPVPYMEMGSCT